MRYYRLLLLATLGIMVPLGYWVRFLNLPGFEFVSDFLGSVAYEIFWIAWVLSMAPRWQVTPVAIAVCLLTCGIEVLQLWQPAWLQALRSTLPGRLVLGNTFSWQDFPAYIVGSSIGWLWVQGLRRLAGLEPQRRTPVSSSWRSQQKP